MRRRRQTKRTIEPDAKYGSVLVAKFINYLMEGGKKSVAQKVLYTTFDIIKKKTKQDPVEIFDLAIKNVSPAVEVKSRRVGGAHYQVPREVRGDRKITLAIRWITQAAAAKKGRPMADRLAGELIDAAQNTGTAVKRRQDVHRMAEANKAFAHFAW